MNWQDWIQIQALEVMPKLPSRREEDWRYVSLKSFEGRPLRKTAEGSIRPEPLGLKAIELVFLNGRLISQTLNQFRIEEVEKNKTPSPEFQAWFEKIEAKKKQIQTPTDLFDQLNQTQFEVGYWIDFQANSSLETPVILRLISKGHESISVPRIWLRLQKRSKASLLLSYEAFETEQDLTIPVEEIELEESAQLELIRRVNVAAGDSQIARTRILQDKSSVLESLSIGLGSKLVRHQLDVFLTGPEAFSRLQGLTYAGGESVVDHHTRIDHVVGGATSQQLYKSILNAKSKSVFNGQVVIRHEAQKASSEQLNQNLLLSSQAEVDSKPQLEIWADDVKATHGSTTGRLDEQEIFYFMSRGIPRNQAERMLRAGFTQDVLMQVSNLELRQWLLDQQVHADQRLES